MSININYLSWILIVLGIALRITDITIPDITTDEAQAALGASAAWTPIGMMTLRAAQWVFGSSLGVIRGTTVLFGIVYLPLIYALSRVYTKHRVALLATALAALFPVHILFSRLANPAAQLTFAWTLTAYCFVRAEKEQHPKWLIALFFASFYATFIKTQGLLLPCALLAGCIVVDWRSGKHLWFRFQCSPISLTLICSLIPVALYILTHPGIAATLLYYGGNQYGWSDVVGRIVMLVGRWWQELTLYLIAIVLSIPLLRKCHWSMSVLCSLGVITGLLLGPGHEYYAVHLVPFALPIALGLNTLAPKNIVLACVALAIATLVRMGPVSLMQSAWTNPLYKEQGYWNSHAKHINSIVEGEEQITILGSPGHHVRFYLHPQILLGDHMTAPFPTRYVLLLKNNTSTQPHGNVVYSDERILIVLHSPHR